MRDFLASKKHLVKFMWNQSYDFWLSFKKEEVWIGYAWPDTVGYADAAGMNYLYMEPKEGACRGCAGWGSPRTRRTTSMPTSTSIRGRARRRRSSSSLGTTTVTRTRGRSVGRLARCGQRAGARRPDGPRSPTAIPESYIPRRDVYQQYWSEVLAS